MAKFFHPEQYELSNGIPVVLQHCDSPVAATYWWVKVGSADENHPQAGFAHFLEHMLFKDAAAKESGTASTGKMARVIESLGGDINAYTSFDQTVYHVTCAAQHWERIIDSFGIIAKPQKFLKQDFEREREVILEELRKNEDSPGRQLFQGLFSGTFAKHPYGRPVIGFVETLKAAKVKELEAFYSSQYVSNKMGLVLVGPIHSPGDENGDRRKSILKSLEKRFGQAVLRRAKKPKVVKKTKSAKDIVRKEEPTLREKANWKIKTFDVKTPTLSFSFRVPALTHEDIPALDLLTGILGMGELSRLYQRLFYETSLATDVSGGLYVPKDPGMVYFQAEVDSMEKLPRVAEEMFEVLQKIGEEGPTEAELQRVLVNSESERLYATQTADGMAGRLGFLKFTMGNLAFDQQYLDELREVDSNRIKEVAKKYFDARRMSGVILVPKDQANYDIAAIEEKANRIFGVTVNPSEPLPSRKPESAKVFHLDSGMRVCFNPRPDSQVFSIHASALGGVRLEVTQPIESAEKDWGASYMMALAWSKGTGTRNSREIAAAVEGRAASMDGFSGRNSIGLQMTGLARDWRSLSETFTDVLMNPTFPEEEVDHARRIAEDSIRSIEDHSSQLCSKLFLETLFQNHPYGQYTYGSLDSVRNLQSEKLKAFHQHWLRPERMVISVSGAVKWGALESWLKQLESYAAQAKAVAQQQLATMAKIESEPSLKSPRWVEKSVNREQCHILVGGLGTQITADDRHAIRLLQTILGGQSGRLFIELREKKSLAYTVAPISFEGLERGYIGTYIACSQSKREEALIGIKQVLEKLASKGPTAQEMDRAKEFFLGRRAMDLQSDSSLAAHYGLEALYDVPHLDELALIKKVRAVTPKEVRQVCQKYLVDQHMVTACVG